MKISHFLVLSLLGCGTQNKPLAFDAATIDAEIQRLMKLEDVQGLALAIIDNGKVIYVAAYGQRNNAIVHDFSTLQQNIFGA